MESSSGGEGNGGLRSRFGGALGDDLGVGSKKMKKQRKFREAQNPRHCCWERDGRNLILYILK